MQRVAVHTVLRRLILIIRVYSIRTKFLDLDYSIQKIIIYGAGVIGCEYASIFIGLDHKVDLINTQHKLLSYLDDEISDALSYHLRQQGVLIRHNEQIDHLETYDDHVVLHLQSGKKLKQMLFCGVTVALEIRMA